MRASIDIEDLRVLLLFGVILTKILLIFLLRPMEFISSFLAASPIFFYVVPDLLR